MEMEDLSVDGVPVTHGHKVAMGTLAAAAFTEILFSRREAPAPGAKGPDAAGREAEVRKAFGGENPAGKAAVKTALEKLQDEKAARNFAAALRDNWKTLREKVLEQLLPYNETRSLLEKGGCPIRAETINLSRAKTIATAKKAQMIRNRYTVLDLAWDLGLLDQVLREMEASEIYLR
jgi:glycerol-1-phosphate dehydrogenase [NAD(P)+]